MPPALLTAGDSEILVYSDGSFSDPFGIGAWAWQAPSLAISSAGSGWGVSSHDFELLAILKALEAVAALDHSSRRIRLHTDSESVTRIFMALSDAGYAKPETGGNLRDLLLRAAAISASRTVRCVLCNRKDEELWPCHQAAIRIVREQVQGDPRFNEFVTLCREQKILGRLRARHKAARRQLEQLSREIQNRETRIGALLANLRTPEPLAVSGAAAAHNA